MYLKGGGEDAFDVARSKCCCGNGQWLLRLGELYSLCNECLLMCVTTGKPFAESTERVDQGFRCH